MSYTIIITTKGVKTFEGDIKKLHSLEPGFTRSYQFSEFTELRISRDEESGPEDENKDDKNKDVWGE